MEKSSKEKLIQYGVSNSPYSSLYINGKLVSVNDMLLSKYDKVYSDILYKAIDKYCSANGIHQDDYIWRHVKPQEISKAPKVTIINKKFPYGSKQVNISKYWSENEYIKNINNKYSEIMIDEDSSKDLEIVNINYAKGKCILESRMTGNTIEVDFNHLPTDVNVSDDKCTLKDTFSYLIQHN